MCISEGEIKDDRVARRQCGADTIDERVGNSPDIHAGRFGS